MTDAPGTAAASPHYDVVVVGAGFTGLYALYRMREQGLSVHVVERGSDVGGTWFWNRYPGARCDIESVDYSYSFSKELREEWIWTERYATQPEILSYLNHVADRFDLRKDITFSAEVTEASYLEDENMWRLTTSGGRTITATYCVLGVGNLSEVKVPRFEGLDNFSGEWHHTGMWPDEDVDFTSKTVGVIGTGSTGIQAIPQIAARARDVFVFQRTPSYSVPARNRPLDPNELRAVNADYPARRALCEASDAGVPIRRPEMSTFDVSPEVRRQKYEEGWARGGIHALSYAFDDFFYDEEANRTAQDFAREQIASMVADTRTANALMPRQHIGTRRTCVDTGYFETYNRPDVHLVDLREEAIRSVTHDGIRTAARDIPLDILVFAIGFDAMTGAIGAIDIRGRGGRQLRMDWEDGPRTYLGLASAGYPNLFLVTGPGSPSVLSNMVVSIEQHVDWIASCLTHLRANGTNRIEATVEAQDRWVAHVNELADATLYPQATSWYMGSNIPGKPRVFMPYVGGCGRYRQECELVVSHGYEGFRLDKAGIASMLDNDREVLA